MTGPTRADSRRESVKIASMVALWLIAVPARKESPIDAVAFWILVAVFVGWLVLQNRRSRRSR